MSVKTGDKTAAEKQNRKSSQGRQKIIHVLSNTHWDREWRFPFQQTRLLLVSLVDRLLELMETRPDYRYFNFDSQTIFLDDYLELRPENRERLAALIRDKRLIVGPWYTLPEEYCVGGESLVRNLLMGRRVGDSFGYTSRVGYTPTSYGQISQMAQLYAGFDVDGIIFYRGICPDECTNEYFLESPDGTRILGVRLSRYVSRGAFFLYVSRRTMHEKDFRGYQWGDEGCLPFHFCRADEDHEEEPVLLRTPYRNTCNLEHIEEGVRQAMDDVLASATTDCLVLFDGMDSTAPNPNLPEILEAANRVHPDWKFEHSSLPRFLEDLKSRIQPDQMTVLKGERRHPSVDNMFNAFLKDSISSRMYLKQRNAQVERALIRWAEPFSCLAWMMGAMEYPSAPLTKAWKELLACHPHDSIAGLSPDQIHKDMMARFDQAQIVADTLSRNAIGELVARIDTSSSAPEDVLVTLFNPLPSERNDVVPVYVDFPRDKEYRAFDVFDDQGERVPAQIISREESYLIATEPSELPMTFYTTKWKMALEAKNIPALGYKTFTVRPKEGYRSNYGTQLCSECEMENEFLKVSIEPNGTLKVKDKASGQEYSRLLYFEDCGEMGDPWLHRKPFADRVQNTLGCRADIQLLEDGPLLTTFSVALRWSLPAELDRDIKQRSEHEKEMRIVSRISLRKGVPRVGITVEVDNTVRDHRLRVLFDPGFRAEQAYAHGQFDVLERPVHLPDTSDWLEPKTGTNPQLGTVCVENGQRGLAVFSLGLTEYEVLDREDSAVALTLLRAFGYPKMSGLFKEDRVVRQGNEGSQCPGTHRYELALYFYRGRWEDNRVLREEAEHKSPPLAVHHGRYRGEGLSRCESFFSLDPDVLCLSGIKKAEDSDEVIVRFYNPTGREVSGRLWCRAAMEGARELKLSEEPLGDLEVEGRHTIRLTVSPKKIVTIGLRFRK